MSTPTTTSMPIRVRRKWLFAIAAVALAAAIASVPLAVDFGSNEKTRAPVTQESADVQAISSLTTAQLAAAFGAGAYSIGPVWTSGLTPNERRYVERIASLTREQQAAAFGNGR
jgi:hypothetical protein